MYFKVAARLNSGNDGNDSVGLFVNGAGVATAYYYYNEYYGGYLMFLF